jgi:Amidase
VVHEGLGLVTVIKLEATFFGKDDLQSFIADARDSDDVFQESFLQHVLFLSKVTNRPISLGEGVETLLQSYGNERIDLLYLKDDIVDALPTGPYVAHQKHLWQPWRIYSDTQSAFMVSLEPRLSDTSKYVAHTTSDALDVQIVVPSRLYAKGDPKVPLRGFRVAVKDAFDIKGIKTSLCNKAYFDLYPECVSTASAVSSLVSKGAIVVGKTRLNSLISKEDPTEAVDYSAPFNPRGDGYQSPTGSSSGSAAAIASYD